MVCSASGSIGLVGGALLGMVLLPLPGRPGDAATSAGDRVPAFRRLLVPEDRLLEAWAAARAGAWVKLSRPDFERRVERARQALEKPPSSPTLTDARYQARLSDDALVGSARWTVVNRGTASRRLPMSPLGLALREARWGDDPSASDAVVGVFDADGLAVDVPPTEGASLHLEWSARGEPGPEGTRFSLQVPRCAVSVLELELPADRSVSATESYLLDGPLPGAAAGWSRWRIVFGGRSRLDLNVRRAEPPGRGPSLVFASVRSRQRLEPDLLTADFDFRLELPREPVRALRFACDPGLEPTDVGAVGAGAWDFRPASDGRPAVLTVPFPSGFSGGRVQVRCVCPLAAGAPWVSPTLTLRGAVLEEERLRLEVHPDVTLENWDLGTYRLVSSAPAGGGRAGRRPTPSDGLELAPSGPVPAGGPRRPSAGLRLAGPAYGTRERVWWQLRADGPVLVADVRFDVSRGRLFSLPVEVPPGWEVTAVELLPEGLLRRWSVVTEHGRAVLRADLRRAVTTGTGPDPVRLKVTLGTRGRLAVSPAGAERAFPDVAPVGAVVRQGVLGVSIGPDWAVERCETSAAPTADRGGGPWGGQAPDYAFAYHGGPVKGTIRLRPHEPRAGVHCASEVVAAGAGLTVVSRIVLRPEAGAPEQVPLLMSAPFAGEPTWKTRQGNNRVSRFERLAGREAAVAALITCRNPTAAAILLPAVGRKVRAWRLVLERPLREPVELEAVFRAADGGRAPPSAPATEARLREAPLPVGTAAGADGEVVVRFAPGDPVRLVTEGLTAQRLGAAPDAVSRRFRYAGDPVRLLVAVPPSAAGATQKEVIESATLTTEILPPDRLVHRFEFQVRSWRQATLPIRLPDGARLIAARADGRWAGRFPPSAAADGAVEVPVPAGDGAHRIEVTYETPAAAGVLWWCARAPAPQPPLTPRVLRRVWALPPSLVPATDGLVRAPDRAGAPDATDPDAGPTSRGSAAMDAVRFWEPPPGAVAAGTLWLMSPALPWALGALLAGVLALAALALGRRRRATAALLLAWVGAAAAGLFCLPLAWRGSGWILLPAAAVLAPGLLLRAGHRLRVARVAAGLLLAGVLVVGRGSGRAGPERADASPFTVFLLPGSASSQTVLAPQELIDRLDRLGAADRSPALRPVLVAARYSGAVQGASGELQADYQAWCYSDEPSALELPLDGLELREVRLDDRPASASVAGGGRTYRIALRGRGAHALRCRFVVPLAGSATDPELRLPVPPVPCTRLALDLPAGSSAIDAPGRGWYAVGEGSAPAPPHPRLEADFGNTRTVRLRWRQPGSPDPSSVRVREAYLWDLRVPRAHLAALLRYTAAPGTTDSVSLDLPEGLVVRGVEASGVPGADAAGPAPRLLDWRFGGTAGPRRLRLEFSRPIQAAQVRLDLLLERPVGADAVLAVPGPLGATPPDGGLGPLLAFRVEGARPRLVENLRVKRVDAGLFRRAWDEGGLGELPGDLQAFVFQRSGEGGPRLRLNLAPAPSGLAATQSLAWRVGDDVAELSAEAHLRAPGPGLIVARWSVPEALVVADVSGPDVRSWSRLGSAVEVWFERPKRNVRLELTGWIPRAPTAVKGGREPPPLDLSGLAIEGAEQTAFVHLRPMPGRALSLEGATRLVPLPTNAAPEVGCSFLAEGADFRVTVQTLPAGGPRPKPPAHQPAAPSTNAFKSDR